MKKILSFLVAAILSLTCLVTVVGCGGDKVDGILVRMVAVEMPTYYKKWCTEMENKFNEEVEGVTLKITYDTKSNLSSSIATTIESKNKPSIYWCSYGNLYGTFIQPNYAANIANYVSKEAIDDLTPQGKAAVTFGDTMYAYPMYFEPSMMLFYSKTILDDAGVDVSNINNWKWGDLLDACAKVKANTPYKGGSKYPIAVPWSSALYWATTGMALNTTGEQPIADDWVTVNVDANDESWVAMTSFFWDIYDNGYAPRTMGSDVIYDDIVTALIKGQYAMTIGYSAGMAIVNQQYGNNAARFNDIGFAPMPTWENAKNPDVAPSVNGGWGYVISNRISSEEAEAAAKVIEYFSYDGTEASVERLAGFFEASAYSRVPVNQKVRDYIAKDNIDPKFDYRHLIQEIADKSIVAPSYFDGAQSELSTKVYDMRTPNNQLKQQYGNPASIPSTDARAIAKIKEEIANGVDAMKAAIAKDGYRNPYLGDDE